MTTTPTAVPGPAVAPIPPRTWRGLAIRTRQKVAANVAAIALLVPTMYLVVASAWLSVSHASWSATAPPTESELARFAWQYQLSEGPVMTVVQWGYPPLLVMILLFVAMAMVSVSQGMANPIRKAKGKVASTRFASPRERGRMHAELKTAGYGGLANRTAKVRLIVGGALAAVAAILVAVLPLQDGFSRGYGPTVALLGAGVAVVAVLAATPWGHWPEVTLLEDGTLLVDGVEPLSAAGGTTPPATPVQPPMATAPFVAAPPAMPPGWYPDPGGGHERRYWDGAQWTTSVADTEVSDDSSHRVPI